MISDSLHENYSEGKEDEGEPDLEDSNANNEDGKEVEVDREESKSRCITHQDLDEMIIKLEALQSNITSDLEDIGNNLAVVKTQYKEQLESSLSIVSRTTESSLERSGQSVSNNLEKSNYWGKLSRVREA